MSILKLSVTSNKLKSDQDQVLKTDFTTYSVNQEMGLIVTKSGQESAQLSNINSVLYFAVNIPIEFQNEDQPSLYVFTDREEAVKVAKKHKKSRFKSFKTKAEALEFALHGQPENVLSYPETPIQSHPVGEKPVMFKGPKVQDLIRLKKSIEAGDIQLVETTVWSNPRYLISSGDTPSILQEGSRYNALHIAAKSQNATITDFILQTIRSPTFVGLLYGDDNIASCEERASILLDLYLNTPDKGLNETPLHFAVKFGAVDVVEVLVACPKCDKDTKNKFGQTPLDIICSRVNPPNAKLKMQIVHLLKEQFYVPVLRSKDNTLQPTIGLPFSPTQPLLLNTNPMDSQVEIQAYAGPMNQEQATIFRRQWKTPPRRSNCGTPNAFRRLQDTKKGLEIAGRELAKEFGCDWNEYWKFLDTFVDLASPVGLGKFEAFLKEKFYPTGNFESLAMGDISTENIKEYYSTCQNTEEPISPMTDLCNTLEACSLLDTSRDSIPSVSAKKMDRNDFIYAANDNKQEELLLSMITNPGLSPFVHVEKSCHIFGKRIADGLIHASTDGLGDSAVDMLTQEMKHLQALINRYLDDPRFLTVDFHLVHSRISQLVIDRINSLTSFELGLILGPCLDIKIKDLSGHGSSDEEEPNAGSYRSQRLADKLKKRDEAIFNNHVKCISQMILNGGKGTNTRSDDKKYRTEEECMKIWSDAVKCTCHWQTQSFLRHSRKASSYRRLKYTSKLGSNVGEPTVRQLTYEEPEEAIEDNFFTPPSSPKESDDEYMSSAEEDEEIFIEGATPSTVDLSVLQALERATIPVDEYPNVYRWRHMMLLRPEKDRASWHNANCKPTETNCTPNGLPSTPGRKPSLRFKPSESWHRVVAPCSASSPQYNQAAFTFSVPHIT